MTPYTLKQRAHDAEFATAMGWRQVAFPPGSYYWHPPGTGGDGARYPLPRFHESHEARAALLEWLAEDDGRWEKFEVAFIRLLTGAQSWPDGYAPIRTMMIATPAQVAEAAHRVITGGKK